MSFFAQQDQDRYQAIDALVNLTRIIPTVEILDEFDAVPLADALEAGGVKALEINLRTEASYEAITIIQNRCPNLIIGAGNIKTPAMLEKAIDAGAEFGSSPGNTDKLLNAVEISGLPFLPGVANGSEMMRALEYGHTNQRLCPAISVGGVKALKYFQGLFHEIKYAISGGINDDNIKDFLVLSNVSLAFGSWIVRAHDIYSKKWTKVIERTEYSFDNIKKITQENKMNECSDPECDHKNCQSKAA